MFVCSCASPVILLSEFYLPFPFSLLSVRFHHFESEASRGYPMSARVIQQHHFSSSSGKSSSPLSRVDSSYPKILSPTLSHFSNSPVYLISFHLFILSIPLLTILLIPTHNLSHLTNYWLIQNSSCIYRNIIPPVYHLTTIYLLSSILYSFNYLSLNHHYSGLYSLLPSLSTLISLSP